jgi:type IV secretory pathway TrbD component
MKKNVGGVDRIIRIVLGVVILAVGLITQSWWGLIGLVPLLTAGMNFCPLYTIIGINTVKK